MNNTKRQKIVTIFRFVLVSAMILLLIGNVNQFNTKTDGTINYNIINESNPLIKNESISVEFNAVYSGACAVKVRFVSSDTENDIRNTVTLNIYTDKLIHSETISIKDLSDSKYHIYEFDSDKIKKGDIVKAELVSEEDDINYAVRLCMGNAQRTDVKNWYSGELIQPDIPDITLVYSHFGITFFIYLSALILLLVFVLLEYKIDYNFSFIISLILCLIYSAGIFCVTLYLSERLNSNSFRNIGINSLVIIFILYLSLSVLFYGISNHIGISSALSGIVLLLLSVVNYYVYRFRGTVFVPQDIAGAGTAKAVAAGYDFRPDILVLLVIFFIGTLIVTCGIFDVDYHRKKLKDYLISLILVIVGLIGCNFTTYLPEKMNSGMDIWDQNVSSHSNGFIVNFLDNIKSMKTVKPDNYNASALYDEVSEYINDYSPSETVLKNALITQNEKPNIIVIMDESFADVTDIIDLNEYGISDDVYSFLHSIDNSSGIIFTGNTAVSIWGGGTSGSEYEFLSGASYRTDTASLVPYLKYYQTESPCLSNYYRDIGYDTVAIHMAKGSNWYRNRAYPNMGFDIIEFESDVADSNTDILRGYYSDSSGYDYLTDLITSDENPVFAFHVTIQNHGGYSENEDLGEYAVSLNDFDGEYKGNIETYLGLMNASDKQLKAFLDNLENIDEPTVVLFFGDHWSCFDSAIMAQFGISTDNFSDEEYYLYHSTPYVVWSNCGYDFSQCPDNTSAEYLGAILTEQLGFETTLYQKFLLKGMRDYPVYSLYNVRDSEGNEIDKSDENLLRFSNLYAKLQYNMLNDTSNTDERIFG